MIEKKTFKNFAFISYNSNDARWARKLQNKLEAFRLPSVLKDKLHFESDKPIQHVFFAEMDIQPGPLEKGLQKELDNSMHLIVICSPNSARSNWVGKEIRYFFSLNRKENIHFFIIEGIPNSDDINTECYHPVIKELGLSDYLGVNINEKLSVSRWSFLNKIVSKERAYIQLISKMLGIEFDSIWQRHKRKMIHQITFCIIGGILVIASFVGIRLFSLPCDITIHLFDISGINEKLPNNKPKTITLFFPQKEPIRKTIIDGNRTVFEGIDPRYIGNKVHLLFESNAYVSIDTQISLSRDINLMIKRDSDYYGNIKLQFCDSFSRPIQNIPVSIKGLTATTDIDGKINLHIPFEQQDTAYQIITNIPLADDSVFMPCRDYGIILVH